MIKHDAQFASGATSYIVTKLNQIPDHSDFGRTLRRFDETLVNDEFKHVGVQLVPARDPEQPGRYDHYTTVRL